MTIETSIEQSLIGGLMKIGNTESDIVNHVLRQLKPNSFYHRVNREMYKAIRLLASSEQLFDSLSVASYLAKQGDIELIDVDRAYLNHCDAKLLRQYTNTIKDASIERYALSKIDDLKDLISNHDNGNITQRIGLAESVITSILDSTENRKSTGSIINSNLRIS